MPWIFADVVLSAGQGKMGIIGQGAASERRAGRERLMCPDCHLLPDPTHLPHSRGAEYCSNSKYRKYQNKKYLFSSLPTIN